MSVRFGVFDFDPAQRELRREGAPVRLQAQTDVGDRWSSYCVLDEERNVIGRGQLATEAQPLDGLFRQLPASVVALEVGTHLPWMSRVLQKQGHKVIVANARRVKRISESSGETDRLDAEFLARLARADEKLLAPLRHRSQTAQVDLMGVRVRAQLAELRTQGGNAARG